MTFRHCFALVLCLFVSVPAWAEERPLSDLTTFPEIANYIQQERGKLNRRDLGAQEYAVAFGDMLIRAGDRLLEVAQNDMEKRTAYNFKLTALRQQVDAGVEGAEEKMDALLKEWGASEDPNLRGLAHAYRFTQFGNAARRAEVSPESFQQFKSGLKTWIDRKEAAMTSIVSLGLEIAERHKVPARQFIQELVEHIQSPQYAASAAEKERLIQSLEGVLRLAVGSDPKIYGRTLDDEEFKWESLREKGKEKYVLIKFTATWCGPCQMELPGMLEAYEKYSGKGLEIVSIYIWQREADPVATVKDYVEEKKIPWIVISEELSKRADHPEYGNFYSITGVPTMVLADKEGKIIAAGMEARGNRLQDKLAEIFR